MTHFIEFWRERVTNMLDATYSIFDIQTVQTSSENDDIGEMVKNALTTLIQWHLM